MQRHGSYHVHFAQQVMADTRQPLAECWNEIEAVSRLVCEDYIAAFVVIAHHGAGQIERGTPRQTAGAKRVRSRIDLEWVAAQRAAWAVEEGNLRPARAAQAVWIGNWRAT